MSISYLNNIDLNKNELRNAAIHVLAANPANPAQGQIYFNSSDNKLLFYDGTNWIDASGDIKSVITSTPSTLSITDTTGPNPSIATVTAAITSGGTALATGDDIHTFVNTQIGLLDITFRGTANEIVINNSSSDFSAGDGSTVTIGLPDDVTITNDLNVGNDLDVTGNAVIDGNLTVSGTTTTVNSNTVNIGDSIITLNSDESGSPSQDAGIEVERGSSANRSLIWDESEGDWKIQQDSGTYERIATYGDSVEDVTVTETGSSGLTVTETLSGTDNRIKSYDVSLNFSDFTYKASIGGSTSVAVTHNLGTKDVIVQLYDSLSGETVYAEVIRNTVNQVTVGFATAPAASQIRILIQKM